MQKIFFIGLLQFGILYFMRDHINGQHVKIKKVSETKVSEAIDCYC